MTFAQFERVDHEGRIELLAGELLTYHPNGIHYAESSSELAFMLRLAGVKAHAHMGYLLNRNPGTWLAPSVSVIHRNQRAGKYYESAPLIAIETIVTPEHSTNLPQKIHAYLDHGSIEVWVLHHKERRALVYSKDTAPRVETGSFHTDLLPGVEVPFDKFFL
jgi:Uma2 family endonuclease